MAFAKENLFFSARIVLLEGFRLGSKMHVESLPVPCLNSSLVSSGVR